MCGPRKIKLLCMAFTLFSISSMAFPSPPVRKFRQYHRARRPSAPHAAWLHMRRFQAAENESDAPKPATCTSPFCSPAPPFCTSFRPQIHRNQGSSRPRPNQGSSTPSARGRRPVTHRRRGRLPSRFGTCGGRPRQWSRCLPLRKFNNL